MAGLLVISVAISCQTQEPVAKQKRRTVWVSAPVGSLIGGGFVDAGDVDTTEASSRATTASTDKPSFRTALANFDAQSGTVVEGWALIVPAVAWQTGVPVETLKKQRATTRLTFGELLVANSLAHGSGKSFDEILALKEKTRGWSQLAKELNVNIDSITARLRAAGESIQYAQSRRKNRREENLHDTLNQQQPNAHNLGAGGG